MPHTNICFKQMKWQWNGPNILPRFQSSYPRATCQNFQWKEPRLHCKCRYSQTAWSSHLLISLFYPFAWLLVLEVSLLFFFFFKVPFHAVWDENHNLSISTSALIWVLGNNKRNKGIEEDVRRGLSFSTTVLITQGAGTPYHWRYHERTVEEFPSRPSSGHFPDFK